MQRPTTKFLEFITGFLGSEKLDRRLSAGRLVQASIKLKLFSQLGKEIERFIEKGKIKEDFLDKEQSKQSLFELLKFIDTDSPDEDRFEAMKLLFLKSVSFNSSEEETDYFRLTDLGYKLCDYIYKKDGY